MKRKRSDENSARRPSGAAVQRPELTQTLYRALFREWARTGYQAISLERVAVEAGAGKAAIYRRWSSKLAFAQHAIEAVTLALTQVPPQATLEADIRAYLMHLRRGLRHPLIRRILPDLYAEQARGSELSTLLGPLAEFRRAQGTAWLQRAVERGELSPDADFEFALDLIPSPLYWRMVIRNQRITTAEVSLQAKHLAQALKAISAER